MRNAEGGFQPMGERTSSRRPMGVFNQFASHAECGEKGKDIITHPEIVIMKKRSFRYHRFERNLCLNLKLSMNPGPRVLYSLYLYCLGPLPGFFLPHSRRRATAAESHGHMHMAYGSNNPTLVKLPKRLITIGVTYEIPVYRLPPPRKY